MYKDHAVDSEELWNGFQKAELLGLVAQLLSDMGYRSTVDHLKTESQFSTQDSDFSHIEYNILNGNIPKAKELITRLDTDINIKKACNFLCSQQMFLETFHNKGDTEALKYLRDVLSYDAFDEDSHQRVNECATLLIYPTSSLSDICWSSETSRSDLVKQIQFLLSPKYTIPPNRLVDLLRQAFEYQKMLCVNHCEELDINDQPPSLISDHTCENWKFPSKPIQRLEVHSDEIWDISISPNGQFLATASKDETVILWSTKPPFDVIKCWKGHQNVVSAVAWSWDSQFIASCGNDGFVYVWTPSRDAHLVKIEPHTSVVTSIAWIPETYSFITAGMDKQMILHKLIECEGQPCDKHDGEGIPPTHLVTTTRVWLFESRIRSLGVNVDGKLVIIATLDKALRVVSLETMEELVPLPEGSPVTTITCSKLYNQVLVSVAGQRPVMRLWDIQDRRVVQTYRGHREDRYILRSTLGGPRESFVISGSEDSQIYIWNKVFGSLISVIQAHTSTVNAVAWSVMPENYFFSASDDKTVAVWGMVCERDNGEHSELANSIE